MDASRPLLTCVIGAVVIGFGQNSIDSPLSASESSIEENLDDTLVPAYEATTIEGAPHLESMQTLDDVDEDEAFIHDLMAMHPNDEDLVVVDLEELLDETVIDAEEEEAFENVVRQSM